MTPVTPEAEPRWKALAALLREHAERVWPAQLRATVNGGGWDIHDHAARFLVSAGVRAASPDRPEPGLRAAIEAILDDEPRLDGAPSDGVRRWYSEGWNRLARDVRAALRASPDRPEPGLRAAADRLIAARRQGVGAKDPEFWAALDNLEAALRASPDRLAGGLDEAWAKAEAALPRYWQIASLQLSGAHYKVVAVSPTGDAGTEGFGSTPAAALLALADRLSGLTEEAKP